MTRPKINRQPMPNDYIDGGTVVASVDTGVEESLPAAWLLLLLRRSAPFYEVIEINADGEITSLGEHRNIVPAVEMYQDNGGDY